MINQLLCTPIPDHCVAVCMVSGNCVALLAKSGQCLLLTEDPVPLVRDANHAKRVIIRGERAWANPVSNLRPHVVAQLVECLLEVEQSPAASNSTGPVVLLDPDAPSPRARQMLALVPEIERFARMIVRAAPEPATAEPDWCKSLGVSRAARAPRETLLAAIADFGRQTNRLDLVDQAQAVVESLRARDARIGQKQ